MFDFERYAELYARAANEQMSPRRVRDVIFASWSECWMLVLTSRNELLALDVREACISVDADVLADHLVQHRVVLDSDESLAGQRQKSGTAAHGFGLVLHLGYDHIHCCDRVCVFTAHSVSFFAWSKNGLRDWTALGGEANAAFREHVVGEWQHALRSLPLNEMLSSSVFVVENNRSQQEGYKGIAFLSRTTLHSVIIHRADCDSPSLYVSRIYLAQDWWNPTESDEHLTCAQYNHGTYFVGTSHGRLLSVKQEEWMSTSKEKFLHPLAASEELAMKPITSLAIDPTGSHLYIINARSTLYTYHLPSGKIFQRHVAIESHSSLFPTRERTFMSVQSDEGSLLRELDYLGNPRPARKEGFTSIRSVALYPTGKVIVIAGSHQNGMGKRDVLTLFGTQLLQWWPCSVRILL